MPDDTLTDNALDTDRELALLRLKNQDLAEALRDAEQTIDHLGSFVDTAEAELARARWLHRLLEPIFDADPGAPIEAPQVLAAFTRWVERRLDDTTSDQKLSRKQAVALLGALDALEDIVAGRIHHDGSHRIPVTHAPESIQIAHDRICSLLEFASAAGDEVAADPAHRAQINNFVDDLYVARDALRACGANPEGGDRP